MAKYPSPKTSTPALTLDIPEAADMLHIGRSSLLDMLRRGQLRHFRIGRRVLIPRADVEALVAGAPSGAQY